jgi:hypothetical protein
MDSYDSSMAETQVFQFISRLAQAEEISWKLTMIRKGGEGSPLVIALFTFNTL